MSREEKRLRAALEESDELIGAALLDLMLMRLALECIQCEVRDALEPPARPAAPVLHVMRSRRPS